MMGEAALSAVGRTKFFSTYILHIKLFCDYDKKRWKYE